MTGESLTGGVTDSYDTDSTNMRKIGATYRQGTVSAQKQYLYEKEATGMESPKMEFLLQCKKPTSQCAEIW